MERLTGLDADGHLIINEEEAIIATKGELSKNEMRRIMMKLAKKLAEYETKEEEGVLLELPCKPNTEVFKISPTFHCFGCHNPKKQENGCKKCSFRSLNIIEYNMSLHEILLNFDNFGKTFFLTKEEAEKILVNL